MGVILESALLTLDMFLVDGATHKVSVGAAIVRNNYFWWLFLVYHFLSIITSVIYYLHQKWKNC